MPHTEIKQTKKALEDGVLSQHIFRDTEPLIGEHFILKRVRKVRAIVAAWLQAITGNDKEKPLCLYLTDRTSTLAIDTIPRAQTGKQILVHEFKPDRAGEYRLQSHWPAFASSFLKLAEVGILRGLKSNNLCYFTAMGWAFGTVSGFFLIILNCSRDTISGKQVDMISGELPTPLHMGGNGKVILGLPRNVRRTWAWQVTWYLYCLASLATLISTFLVLGRNNATLVYV